MEPNEIIGELQDLFSALDQTDRPYLILVVRIVPEAGSYLPESFRRYKIDGLTQPVVFIELEDLIHVAQHNLGVPSYVPSLMKFSTALFDGLVVANAKSNLPAACGAGWLALGYWRARRCKTSPYDYLRLYSTELADQHLTAARDELKTSDDTPPFGRVRDINDTLRRVGRMITGWQQSADQQRHQSPGLYTRDICSILAELYTLKDLHPSRLQIMGYRYNLYASDAVFSAISSIAYKHQIDSRCKLYLGLLQASLFLQSRYRYVFNRCNGNYKIPAKPDASETASDINSDMVVLITALLDFQKAYNSVPKPDLFLRKFCDTTVAPQRIPVAPLDSVIGDLVDQLMRLSNEFDSIDAQLLKMSADDSLALLFEHAARTKDCLRDYKEHIECFDLRIRNFLLDIGSTFGLANSLFINLSLDRRKDVKGLLRQLQDEMRTAFTTLSAEYEVER